MIMSPPISSFHNYLSIDHILFKTELFDNIHINRIKTKRNSIIKRPMNAFLLWARGERKRVSSDDYGVSQTSLSKFLGETWRNMSVDEKQPFLDTAKSLKRQYHIDHPDYRCKLKQRSPAANRTIARKHHSPTAQRQMSTMNSSNSNITPHSIQPTVLSMCQAIVSSTSSLPSDNNNNEWFFQLLNQPQSVIVTPISQTQISPISSRRAVRIQIINKHDDITLPQPSVLPMTPSPLSSSSIAIDETTSKLVDYLTNTYPMSNIPNNQQGLTPTIDDLAEYEILQNSENNHLMDLDQPYDNNGWIDTPLSNYATNTTDIHPTSSYLSYDFLCL